MANMTSIASMLSKIKIKVSRIRNKRKKEKIRKKIRNQNKRTTFLRLFARNAGIVLLLTAVFAGVLFSAGRKYIFSQAKTQLYYRTSGLQTSVSAAENMQNRSKESLISSLRFSAQYDIMLYHGEFQIVSDYAENCTALVAITDEEGNIQYSSRKGLQAVICLNEEEKEVMLCDTEALAISELTQLEEDYYAMKHSETMQTYVHFDLLSAYVNSKTNHFIPHEAEINLIQFDPRGKKGDEVIETKQYCITIPDMEDYPLVEFDQSGSPDNYPVAALDNFFGTDKYQFDELIHDERTQAQIHSDSNTLGGFYGDSSTANIYYSKSSIWLDGKRKSLFIMFKIDAWNSVTKPLYFSIVAIFLIIVLFIAFLDSWRRNVKNQAEYAFADYQKALTDNLAHDLKTPLMAISGYTENLMENKLSETEKNRYLQAVLDNIAYTDSIVSRTLELNHMYQPDSLKKEKIDVLSLIKQVSEKYMLMLDERNILLQLDGEAELTADPDLLETVFENLISNAVKYTTENGVIQISISPESCRISNTVHKKIDVTDLKRPFKKGDTARSGKSGSGLGLSIADKAAEANYFQLMLSCSDTEYTAELVF
ncbi:MAG: HAMP domain-containing histidine kinase [Oscillospiraceae bacterium]|nr:HAMP domain-containing histidine kinase [Oscillospiraceae bacterium]